VHTHIFRYRRLCPAAQRRLDAVLQRDLPLRDRSVRTVVLLAARGTASAKWGNLTPRQSGPALVGLYLYGAAVHRILRRATVRTQGRCVTADGVRAGEAIPESAVRQESGSLAAHCARQRDGPYALGHGQRVGGSWGASRVGDDPALARGPVDAVTAERSHPLGRRDTGWRVEVPGGGFSFAMGSLPFLKI